MKVFLFVLAAMLPVQVSRAECLAPLIRVSGTVVDIKGTAVPKAIVGVSWLERGKAAGPALASADAKGAFTIVFRWGLFSGSKPDGSDECKGRLNPISVTAYSASARSMPVVVSVGESNVVSGVTLNLNAALE